jgi:spore germination protein GerM
VIVAAVSLCGCGIGPESSAHVIDRKLVPRGLLPHSSAASAPRSTVPTDDVTLYLESANGIVAVNRSVPSPATLRTVLRVLSRAPLRSELAKGMENPLSAARPITLKSLVNGTAEVDLPADFTDLGGQNQIVAAAQLVYTATAFPGVDRVSVLVNGLAASVPTANDSLSPGPLVRTDYAALAPR